MLLIINHNLNATVACILSNKEIMVALHYANGRFRGIVICLEFLKFWYSIKYEQKMMQRIVIKSVMKLLANVGVYPKPISSIKNVMEFTRLEF